MITVARTSAGVVVTVDGDARLVDVGLDDIFVAEDPGALVSAAHTAAPAEADTDVAASSDTIEGAASELLAPIGSQEVWAAGVTYEVSRAARMAESEAAGTADVYARVYDAARPELFFKATPHRVVGPGAPIRIRHDATWNVPEPELALAVSSHGAIFGVTIGNDVSSRDIEGENPLYLPQAKVYDGSAALGPVIVIGPPPTAATIILTIDRDGDEVFRGATSTARIRRPFPELVEYLWRDNSFPAGCFLLTGAGVVPDDGYTLTPGDVVTIAIDGIGELVNPVAPLEP